MPLEQEAPKPVGVILAGGQGTRMAGQDKGLLEHKGRTFAEHLYHTLKPACELVAVNCNRHPDRYHAFADDLFADASDPAIENVGPLAGILTSLRRYPNRLLLFTPCDTPLLTERYADLMLSSNLASIARFAMAKDKPHYLHCLLTSEYLPALEDYLALGRRSVHGWLAAIKAEPVVFQRNAQMFSNVNSPSDLQKMH